MYFDVKSSFEGKIQDVREKIWKLLGAAGNAQDEVAMDIDLMYTFDDAAIIKDYASGKTFEIGFSRIDGDVIFDQPPKEVGMQFITKRLIEENPNITMKTIQEIAYSWDEEYFEDCFKSLVDEIDNPEALYAWVHYQAEGLWPVEKGGPGSGHHRHKGLSGVWGGSRSGRRESSLSKRPSSLSKRPSVLTKNPILDKSPKASPTKKIKEIEETPIVEIDPKDLRQAVEDFKKQKEIAQDQINEIKAADKKNAEQYRKDNKDKKITGYDMLKVSKPYSSKLYEIKQKFAKDFGRFRKKVDNIHNSNRKDVRPLQNVLYDINNFNRQTMLSFKSYSAELTGPIVFKNLKQKIAYAAVLVPGEPDQDFDKGEKILEADEIERVAHKWLEEYGNVDLLHSLNNIALPVESYLLPMEMEVEAFGEKVFLPKGTWILASKVLDDGVWDKVEKGLLTGYSVMGIKRSALKYAMGAIKSGSTDELVASFKKTLIKDLGDDWIAPFVSIVDEPCVPKAKFFALKSKEGQEVSKGGLLNAIKSKLKGTGPAEQGGKTISDELLANLKQAVEMLTNVVQKAEGENNGKGGDDLNEEEIRELVDSTVKSALDPFMEKLDTLATKELDPPEDEEDEEEEYETSAGKSEEESSGLEEAFKTLAEKVDQLEKVPKQKAASKSLKGQDGDDGKDEYSLDEDRDMYGRKRVKE